RVIHMSSLPSLLTVPPTPVTYTLSLHDALPIWAKQPQDAIRVYARSVDREGHHHDQDPQGEHPALGQRLGAHVGVAEERQPEAVESEEHTSELQSRVDLVCRLLLEKKKKKCNKT